MTQAAPKSDINRCIHWTRFILTKPYRCSCDSRSHVS
jgi:hypothetical protein